jgi:hypothetical protein
MLDHSLPLIQKFIAKPSPLHPELTKPLSRLLLMFSTEHSISTVLPYKMCSFVLDIVNIEEGGMLTSELIQPIKSTCPELFAIFHILLQHQLVSSVLYLSHIYK